MPMPRRTFLAGLGATALVGRVSPQQFASFAASPSPAAAAATTDVSAVTSAQPNYNWGMQTKPIDWSDTKARFPSGNVPAIHSYRTYGS